MIVSDADPAPKDVALLIVRDIPARDILTESGHRALPRDKWISGRIKKEKRSGLGKGSERDTHRHTQLPKYGDLPVFPFGAPMSP